jgi:hypothetical protein
LIAPTVEPEAATLTGKVRVVPVLPVAAPKLTSGVSEVGVEYWLKPVPVKVTEVEAAPAFRATVEELEAVTTGATVLASPRPMAPASVYVASLPPAATRGF